MFPSLTTFLDNLQKNSPPAFSLADYPGFPAEEFSRNQARYDESERWYQGDELEDTIVQDGNAVERYPVKINPFKSQVQKHAHFLFGEVKQDERPLVYPRVLPKEETDAGRKQAQSAEEVIQRIWWESNGRSIQWENGALSQIYGGCVFRLAWDTLDPLRSIPVRIDMIHPRLFVGKPYANDMWRLREAWVVRPITAADAMDNGIVVQDPDTDLWLIEHWTETSYIVTVNNLPARRMLSDGTWIDLSGSNPWGFVPFVYIPHIRVGGFYGDNDIDHLVGIVKEINLRVADYGDAVNVDSHAYLGMRDVNGAPQIQQLAPSLYAINLGNTQALTGQDAQPDLFELRKASASQPMEKLIEILYDFYRRFAFIPSVVDGEDEGSQRSGLTLAMRMIALTQHTDTERIFWSTGLDILNRMILRMCQIKGEAGITEEHLSLIVRQDWSPVLPRDREMIVQEAATLIAAKLGSPERLLTLLGVDDVEEERELILKFWKEIQEMAAANKQDAPQHGKSGDGSGQQAKNPAQNKSSE